MFLYVWIIIFSSCPFYAYAKTTYTVKKGDSLYRIARNLGVSVSDIEKSNKLRSAGIKPGDRIYLPSGRPSVKKEKIMPKAGLVHKKHHGTEQEPVFHAVKSGDTLTSIARGHSLSLAKLKEFNNNRAIKKLKIGTNIIVGFKGPEIYRVKKGDTVNKIAKKFNLETDELKDMNNMDSDTLKPGQKLQVSREENEPVKNYDAIISARELDEYIKAEVETKDMTGDVSVKDKLVLFARKMLNFPYRFGGSTLMGIDCSAYVQKVYGFIGMNIPRSAREQFREGETVDREELSIGDLVFFRTYASFPSHVGIYLGNNMFIHASSRTRKVTINSLDTPYYLRRFIGAKRLLMEERKEENFLDSNES